MTETSAASAANDLLHLTLEERVALTSGGGAWTTKAVGGMPAIILTDGPHGVRLQSPDGDQHDLANSVPATCFPPAVALGCTFDLELAHRVGDALGREARALGVGVLLGPGINLKRSLLGGRNFEYFSEDPYVSARLGSALVSGIQSAGAAASVKHFAANNQETDRLRVSADIDERPFREMYLRAFEHVIRVARPKTVMCAYNKVNGVLVSENSWLLTDVLRSEWGYDGVVVSDWGAVDDRVEALRAGLDLEMPSSQGRSDELVVRAIQEGRLSEDFVNRSASRIAALVRDVVPDGSLRESINFDAHHRLALEAAEAGLVLLKNDGTLPLKEGISSDRVSVVGELARSPRYQGAGSSLVNPTRLESAIDHISTWVTGEVRFAPGYTLDGSPDATLAKHAVALAQASDVVLFFVGIPAQQESEGFDRIDWKLPADQLDLLDAVLDTGSKVVVVISNGGVVDVTRFATRSAAVIEGWLLGQSGGEATARTLFGLNNPCGKLAETIPLRLEDTPSHLNFPGEHGHVRYGEGLFVGYRWYDAKAMDVAYPFGHGLSYTTFEYSRPTIAVSGDQITVELQVKNTGGRDGAEVVQVYATHERSAVQRPCRELRGFRKVHLRAGVEQRVELVIQRSDLAYWDDRSHGWAVEEGIYRFDLGASSRDIRLTVAAYMEGDRLQHSLSMESSITEVLESPRAADALRALFEATGDSGALRLFSDPEPMLGSFPLGRIASFQEVSTSREQIAALLEALRLSELESNEDHRT